MTTYTYDAEDRLTSVTDPLGRVTTYDYDPAGRLVSVTTPDPDGAGPLTAPVTTYTYDNLGRVTSTTDPLGRITAFAYDVRDRLTTITAPDPDGAGPLASPVTSYGYDAVGRPTTVTDPLNRVTTYDYDTAGQLTTITQADPDGAGPLASPVATLTYDNLGRLATTVDPLERTSNFAYDMRDRLTTITAPDPDGAGPLTAPVTGYGYDAVGNRTTATDPLGKTTTFAYDRLDRLVAVTDPRSGKTRYAYDAAGNTTAVTDPLGQTTTSAYDRLDRLVTVTDPRSGQTGFAYDAVGNRTTVTDPVGNFTTFTYDALDRVTAIIDPRGLSTTLAYDVASQLTGVTDRLGRRTAFGYDGLGRRTDERWLDGLGNTLRAFTYSYDAASQLLGSADPDATLSFTYDHLGRQTTASTSGSGAGQPNLTLTSGYDAVGNRTRLADDLAGSGWAGPGVTTFAYDALDRLTTINRSLGSHAGPQVGFGYDVGGRLTALSRTLGGVGTAVDTSFAYDALDRLTTLTHQVAGGATLASYTYGYDAASRLIAETNAEGAVTYTYDATDQLTGVGGARSEGYSYDLNGNRTLPGYVTGTGNRLEQAPGLALAYDAEGNLTSRTETATGVVTTYAYDHRNRLTGVTRKDSGGTVVMQATYTYDAFDRRIGTLVDTDGVGAAAPVQSWTAYDGVNPYADFDGTGTLKTRYLHGPAIDMLLARTDAAGATAWYLTDRLGTVRDLADTAGTVIDHVAYDSFGRVTAETNPSAGDRFKFTGRELDAETGLQYHRARYYDAALGRWTQEDPIGFTGGDANLYRYVGNSPVMSKDPSGLIDWGDVLVRAGGLLQFIGGVTEGTLGAGLIAAPEPTTLSKIGGAALMVHGADTAKAGLDTFWNGSPQRTVTSSVVSGSLQEVGMSSEWADSWGGAVDMGIGLAGPTMAGRVLSRPPSNFGPARTPNRQTCPAPSNANPPPKAVPRLRDVVEASKTTAGNPAQKADAMKPLLDEISKANPAFNAGRIDNRFGSGFFGEQGEVIFAAEDGVTYVGKISGNSLIDLAGGAKHPSQIPGINPAR